MIGENLEPIEAPSNEWLRTFESYSTDLPSGAPQLEASLDVTFPGRKESRTVIQTLVQVEAASATLADLAGARSYGFELIGEILRADADTGADRLFESFRYRFEFPVEEADVAGGDGGLPAMPLVAQRYLRPGSFKLILRVDDLNGDAVWRHAQPLEVPRVEEAAGWTEADLEPIFAEANRSLASGEPSIRIISPGGDLVSGYLRFDTAATGPLDKVRFTLDDKDLFTTKRAPYSVDVRLGELPRSQMLRAIAYDVGGQPDCQRLLSHQRFAPPFRRADHRTDSRQPLQRQRPHASPGHGARGAEPRGTPGLSQRRPGGDALRGALHSPDRTVGRARADHRPHRRQAGGRRGAGRLRREHRDHQRASHPRRSPGRLR